MCNHCTSFLNVYLSETEREMKASARCFFSRDICIVVGVVTDITRTDGIRPADPFVTEVPSTTNFVDELGTHFAFQLFHYLLPPSIPVWQSNHDRVWHSRSSSRCHFVKVSWVTRFLALALPESPCVLRRFMLSISSRTQQQRSIGRLYRAMAGCSN